MSCSINAAEFRDGLEFLLSTSSNSYVNDSTDHAAKIRKSQAAT
jgi:hypothetical protein